MKTMTIKIIALYLMVNLIIAPVFFEVVQALTSGPNQPEFSSFEPVTTTDMVNEFTGDFTYNLPVIEIPGPNGGGYALSLSYHSGTTPEEDASWVGYGWTINPGAINRNKRGFADEYHGQKVTYHNKMPKNWTVGIHKGLGVEIYSVDIGLGLNSSIRYNNYKGYGYSVGAGITVVGAMSLGYAYDNVEGNSFSVSVNPAAILAMVAGRVFKDQLSKSKIARFYFKNAAKDMAEASQINLNFVGSQYGLFSYADAVRATNTKKYEGESWKFGAGLQGTPGPVQVGLSANLAGSYAYQKNGPTDNLKAYGYMYSAAAGDEDMMDYYVEKDSPYQRRNKFLGIPFSNADNFIVTGEGLGGGFRFYNKRPGHFHPNKKMSEIDIVQIGLEFEAGLDVGGGADIGVGSQTLKVGKWPDRGNIDNYQFAAENSADEWAFLRFRNDPGGTVLFSDDDDLISAKVKGTHVEIEGSPKIYEAVNEDDRSGRSSYIAYHTNEEMVEVDAPNGKKYKAYTQDAQTNNWINRQSVAKGIGEIVTFNEDGYRYVYGLPVYSRDESNLQYDVPWLSDQTNLVQNFIAYRNITTTETKVGEVRTDPYATSFLLTEIITPDYLDRTLDGPTPDDFGGWTKFNYQRVYGSNDKKGSIADWYHWRVPYTGLMYNRNSMSTSVDDLGSVADGYKEIYYLESIETKTHIAYFVTGNTNIPNVVQAQGSAISRKDGLEAANPVNAALISTKQGNKELQKLEKIVLFAKNENNLPGQILKTVHFQYDYSLCPNVPNNSGDAEMVNGKNLNENEGKLTLKKLWFEYQGIVPAKISPYTFEYQYPQANHYGTANSPLRTKYPDITEYGDQYTAANQNPSYKPANIDAWGNYQFDGGARYERFRPWLDQGPADPKFDPAAWQLKQIILPSGGEIHVQYEQKDYSKVQDRDAMAMVNLLPDPGESNRFYLDVVSLGITTQEEKEKLVELMQKNFLQAQRIYFKFLYRLLNNGSVGYPNNYNCNSEFIDGYSIVADVGIQNDKVYILLASQDKLPKTLCEEFVKTQRLGKINEDNELDCDYDGFLADPSDIAGMLLDFLGISQIVSWELENACTTLSLQDSYFKVPVPRPKKGGGVRVKRLLMYDQGIETVFKTGDEDEVLYGTEYIYRPYDEQTGEIDSTCSTGVATTEPTAIREENPLVTFIPKFAKSWAEKMVAGKDLEDTEGPIGETILPAPAIGHSSVIVKNIHSGKTGTGFTVMEFFTFADYPFDHRYPHLSGEPAAEFTTPIDQHSDFSTIPLGIYNKSISNLWLAQGFRFVQYNIHGKPKMITHHAGDFAMATTTSWVEYKYFEPHETMPVLHSIYEQPVEEVYPGKEMEIIFEERAIEDIFEDIHVEIDVDVGLWGPFPISYASAIPYFNYAESKLNTHVTTKIVSYPAFLKSVRRNDNGVEYTTENIAFDPNTGKAIVTRTYDGYNELDLEKSTDHQGIYRNISIPAAQPDASMGQKAYNERYNTKYDSDLTVSKVSTEGKYFLKFEEDGKTTCVDQVQAGDLVLVSQNDNIDGLYHVGEQTKHGIEIYSTTLYSAHLLGTDANGNPVDVEVIRSGRTNELNLITGNITTYGDTTHWAELHPNYNPLIAEREVFADALTAQLDEGSLVGFPDFVRADGCSDPPDFPFDKILLREPSSKPSYDLDVLLLNYEFENCKSHLYSDGKANGAYFAIDDRGQLVFYESDQACIAQPVDCITLCPVLDPEPELYTLDGVIDASVQTFDDNWDYDQTVFPNSQSTDPYESGQKGKWRPVSNYVYKTGRSPHKNASNPNGRTYNAGIFDEFEVFNWQDLWANNPLKWLEVNKVTKYSPYGVPVEEKDIMGIYSTAKYGYHHTVPTLVARNAPYSAVQFESFENVYGSSGNYTLEDGLAISNVNKNRIGTYKAHSGKASFKMGFAFTKGFSTTELKLKAVKDYKRLFVFKVWVRGKGKLAYSTGGGTLGIGEKHRTLTLTFYGANLLPLDFYKVAQTGEWSLYEAEMTQVSANAFTPAIQHTGKFLIPIWIDDIRVQPLNSTMTTYVYDTDNLRLLTSFDDQHFGSYYQYNAEGQLVRTILETEKGMKTVAEAQYNVPLVSRNE